MAPHSSTLAWKIPWTEKSGRLQSMGSLRVGHDWATSLHFSLHWIFHIIWYPLCVCCLQAHGSSQYCATLTQYASVYTEHTGTHMYIHIHVNLINVYLCMQACGHRYRHIYTHIHICCVPIWNTYRVCICVSTFSSRNDFCFLPPGGTRTCLGMLFG